MEPLCEYAMYFPAAPVSSLSNLSDYTTLPRRTHFYLGETVHFLLVLRFRSNRPVDPEEPVGPLFAQASACIAESRQQKRDEGLEELQCSSSEDGEEDVEEGEPGGRESRSGDRTFIPCDRLLVHMNLAPERKQPIQSALVSGDQVIFCLTVSLEKLPMNTHKAKIMVTVWKQEEEKYEVREHGYLTVLQLRSPAHTFRQEQRSFKAQVSSTLHVLPPPSVQCQQMTISGRHMTILKVVNSCSQEEVSVTDVRILPNYNSAYLPIMPDGSVLIVDNVCHQSAEVTMASFCRMEREPSRLPSRLSALEEQSYLFQLQLQNTTEDDSSQGMEIPLVAVLRWRTPTLPPTRCITSCYSLPSIRLDVPQLVMTASCPAAVRPLQQFWVRYTLLNNLQDFIAVRLMWNSEGVSRQQEPKLGAVLCQSPLSDLGQCRKGSTISFTLAFQILRAGLFELSQHMKLKLQFTASLPAPVAPLNKAPLLSNSKARELGRSHSFSHLKSPRLHRHVRSGSAMEPRAVTPPVGPPTPPPPPDRSPLISRDKIAKRPCHVLVLEASQEAHCR